MRFRKTSVAGVQLKIAHLDVQRIDVTFAQRERAGQTMRTSGHQRHAAVRLLKISKAVTNFDTDKRQVFVAQIFECECRDASHGEKADRSGSPDACK